jgi:hypothetical protein
VAVHLNGLTATSFLMADSNLYECQPPLPLRASFLIRSLSGGCLPLLCAATSLLSSILVAVNRLFLRFAHLFLLTLWVWFLPVPATPGPLSVKKHGTGLFYPFFVVGSVDRCGCADCSSLWTDCHEISGT